jgi:methylenetetrahydrofolate dehydrogenase (NADP+)/methenyltetrahydrofolate cyclohydrolase
MAAVAPEKDVDAFHLENIGAVMRGDYRFLPCTPAGVMELLREAGVDPAGKECVVVAAATSWASPWPCCC